MRVITSVISIRGAIFFQKLALVTAFSSPPVQEAQTNIGVNSKGKPHGSVKPGTEKKLFGCVFLECGCS